MSFSCYFLNACKRFFKSLLSLRVLVTFSKKSSSIFLYPPIKRRVCPLSFTCILKSGGIKFHCLPYALTKRSIS